ncbi:VOC family protein [Acholeplasma equirhinis]|uniref:VOC family protein n=1 Tax=Acholeplasma equirhinis TaxID=555393 RepID=UPI003558FC92
MLRLDGFGLFVNDMAKMITFYRDVLGFEIKESIDTEHVYLIKDDTLFLLYGRNSIEALTRSKFNYAKGISGHMEIALYVDTFDDVDLYYQKLLKADFEIVTEPETMPWGQRTFYFADPEGNLIEIGSFNKPFRR